jgi:serine/threonine-protein kinase
MLRRAAPPTGDARMLQLAVFAVRETLPSFAANAQLVHLRCCTVCGASYRTDFARCPLDGGEVIAATRDPLVGATIGGHYVIEALIGVGAMGRVYRAHHARLLSKRCAVKVLYGELTASPIMRMRFAHEAEAASRLEHPNIVGVLDFGCTDAGLMYLVMELVDGPTLGALLEQGPMLPGRAIRFARQLCVGLAHAHARGIVHRDFKPENILVAGPPGAESLRIADFGLAISISDDADARLTTSGVACTPAYAAPEQLLGHDVDLRADLYGLGVTLYEMLTGGILPFAKRSHEVMAWKLTTEWPAVSTHAPRVPPALARLIRRLLARDPNHRPASATDVIDELDKLARDSQRALRWIPTPQFALASTCLVLASGVLYANAMPSPPPIAPAAPFVATLAPSDEDTAIKLVPIAMHEPTVALPPKDPKPATASPPTRATAKLSANAHRYQSRACRAARAAQVCRRGR